MEKCHNIPESFLKTVINSMPNNVFQVIQNIEEQHLTKFEKTVFSHMWTYNFVIVLFDTFLLH